MTLTFDLPPLLTARLESLPVGLQRHISRVRAIAVELAQASDVAPELADLAAAGHDLARAMRPDALLSQARELGLPVNGVEERVPLLLHGAVAAELLRREGSITDPQVLEAIRWHSTGCRGFSPIGKVVFLADKLDPQKGERLPSTSEMRLLAFRDLDAAVLAYLDHELVRLLREGLLIHPASVEARNELLLTRLR